MAAGFAAQPLATARRLLAAGASWWTAELAGMAPAGWHAASSGLRGRAEDRLILEAADEGTLRLSLRGPGAASLAVSRAQPEAARERVRAFLLRHKQKRAVAIRLDPARLFVTTLDLPRGAARSLDAVVRHQIERLLPLPADALCHAQRSAPMAGKPDRIAVTVAVAKLSAIEELRAVAAAMDLTPTRVITVLPEAGDAPLVLWQPARQGAHGAAPRRLLRGLEIAAALLLVCAYGLHIHRLGAERDRLQAALQVAAAKAAEARALGQQLARSSEALAALRARLDQPSPLQIINDLTALLPLDAWVSDLTIRDRSIEIVGLAPRAADLVATIEASPMFGQARFRSPITLLPEGHLERFDLTLEAKDTGLKDAAAKDTGPNDAGPPKGNPGP